MKYFMILALIAFTCNLNAQEYYFPPIGGDEWETISPEELNWNTNKIDDLYNFLEEKNTKAFLLLKDGKIVLEQYLNDHGKDSIWYWASAGKTVTATLVGLAQEQGYLDINDRTSKYLGKGWTTAPSEKEDMITIWHQLTMTTGLDFDVDNVDCYDPECLKYKADAGTQWYYHNAPYTLLDQVVESATGVTFNKFYFENLRNKIGMDGAWFKSEWNNLCLSTARSMARFGILIANNGDWQNEVIINDKDYIHDMINTSQDLNKSYGYLWWLNGKESFMLPQSEMVFNWNMIPNAPDDMYAAMGKNGQMLNISPSTGLIMVRMGDAPNDENFISVLFNNEIWARINDVVDGVSSVPDQNHNEMQISPNPVQDYILINPPQSPFGKGGSELASRGISKIVIFNILGEKLIDLSSAGGGGNEVARGGQIIIDVSHLPTGMYFIKIGDKFEKFVKE